MSKSKEFNELKNGIKQFEEYFEEDFKDLEKEYSKSKKYSEIIDTQIDELMNLIKEGNARGAQHYLTEYISNVASLQSQRQSIIKDRVNMKLQILNMYKKQQDAQQNGDGEKLAKLLEQFITNTPVQDEENKINIEQKSEEELDAELEEFYKNNKVVDVIEDEEIDYNKTVQSELKPAEKTEFISSTNLSNADRLKQINDMLKR